MSNNITTHVLIATNFGASGSPTPTPGTAQGLGAANFQGPQAAGFNTVLAPPGGGGDLNPGDLVVVRPTGLIPFQFNPAAAANVQRAFIGGQKALQFATYDRLLGIRLTPSIKYDLIENITFSPPRLKKSDVWILHPGYNNVAASGPVNIYNGDEVIVRVQFPGYLERPKLDFQATVTIGVRPPEGVAPLPVDNRLIQRANFDLLDQLLKADLNNEYFDAQASRTLSAGANYVVLFLVSKRKRVYPLTERNRNDNTTMQVSMQINPVGIDSSKPIPSGNAISLINTPADGAAVIASLTAATFAPFIGRYIADDPGSGYPEKVRDVEIANKGTKGHMNTRYMDTPPQTEVNPNTMYSEVCITYRNITEHNGENRSANPLMQVIIFLAHVTEDGILSPNDPSMDWKTLANWGDLPNITSFGNPPVTYAQFLAGTSGVAAGTLVNSVGGLGPAVAPITNLMTNTVPFVGQALPVQVAPNLNFYPAAGTEPDGTVTTFIGQLSNSLNT